MKREKLGLERGLDSRPHMTRIDGVFVIANTPWIK
jgi:hypothetical protein